MSEPVRDDDQDLRREGYLPQFSRSLGSFTAFAAGFSYLSILTGVFQNFYLGYREAGPSFVWTWPIIFIGQLFVALCFAYLAREYPFCGGVYAWSRRTGSHFIGWLTGWVYLASLIVTLAAVALALQITLPQIWSGFQFMESTGSNAAILGAILLLLSTFINVMGNRWLSIIMNVGVITELLATLVLIVLLAIHAVRGPTAIIDVTPAISFGELTTLAPYFAAAVMASYVMYGFDTAGTLAEETVNPRQRAPRAILQALIAAALMGFALLLVALLAAPSLDDPALASDAGGLPYLVKAVLGETVGVVFLCAVIFAIFICTLAVQANTSRILFAMARDGVLPCSCWLAHVGEKHRAPNRAAIVVGLSAGVLLLVNLQFDKIMSALICVCIVWTHLAYLLTNSQLLFGSHTRGIWTKLIAAIAVLWSSLLIVNIGWPRTVFYGEAFYQQYAALIYTAVLLIVGVIVYRFVGDTK
jgi:urea carboxylase system permease